MVTFFIRIVLRQFANLLLKKLFDKYLVTCIKTCIEFIDMNQRVSHKREGNN